MIKVSEVSFLAKKRYCEIVRPGWLGLLYKVQNRQQLSNTEYANYEQLKREMLNVVNRKAILISGRTNNNRKTARFEHLSCVFIVKYSRGVGKIVTVQRER